MQGNLTRAFVTILFLLLWASNDARVNDLDKQIKELEQYVIKQEDVNNKIIDIIFKLKNYKPHK